MSKQYHYIVTYDTDTKEFTMDYEVELPNGAVWDKENEWWRTLEDHEWEDDTSDYNRAGDALAFTIRTLQPLPKETN